MSGFVLPNLRRGCILPPLIHVPRTPVCSGRRPRLSSRTGSARRDLVVGNGPPPRDPSRQSRLGMTGTARPDNLTRRVYQATKTHAPRVRRGGAPTTTLPDTG